MTRSRHARTTSSAANGSIDSISPRRLAETRPFPAWTRRLRADTWPRRHWPNSSRTRPHRNSGNGTGNRRARSRRACWPAPTRSWSSSAARPRRSRRCHPPESWWASNPPPTGATRTTRRSRWSAHWPSSSLRSCSSPCPPPWDPRREPSAGRRSERSARPEAW